MMGADGVADQRQAARGALGTWDLGGREERVLPGESATKAYSRWPQHPGMPGVPGLINSSSTEGESWLAWQAWVVVCG